MSAVLAEDAERGRVRAQDDAVGTGQDDAVGQRDERVLDRERLEGAVVGATTQGAAALGRLLAHGDGIRRRTRVP